MSVPRPSIMSVHGVVAAAHPLAAEAGTRMLEAGGTAFDAAAATAAALNVVEPFMSSCMGLGSATAWVAAEGRVRSLDFVGAIPASFPAERFSTREDLMRGPLSVMPPGNLAGWCELVGRYGRLKLPEILAPAIALAEDGFPLAEFGCHEITETEPTLKPFPAIYATWKANYWPGEAPLRPGHVMRQPDLAKTFRAIAANGPEHFYRGPIGQAVVDHLRALGGTLTMTDLAAVKPDWREPLAVSYRGRLIHVPPPPCEGFQFLLALKMVEDVDFGAVAHLGVEHVDTVVRAIRIAAGVRIRNPNPDPATLKAIFSDDSISALRKRLGDGQPVVGQTEQWMAEPAPGGEDPGHTTSFSIGDRDGNLVCVTQSIGSPFGSGVVVPGAGLCLNNFLFWSDVQRGSPNYARPGAPLPMCMSPSISTRDGRPVLALGTPGSYGIMQTQAQAMIHHVDFGLPLQAAISAPRARLWDATLVEIEPRISAETVAALRARGHDARHFETDWSWRVGGMQAVAVDPETGVMTGAADPRRDGIAAAASGVRG